MPEELYSRLDMVHQEVFQCPNNANIPEIRILDQFDIIGYRSLRVQVPNNHILTQNLYYNHYYPNPKYLIIGYMDPLGLPEKVGLGIQPPGLHRMFWFGALGLPRGGGYVLHCRTVQLLMPKSIVLLGISRLWGCPGTEFAHLGKLLGGEPMLRTRKQPNLPRGLQD